MICSHDVRIAELKAWVADLQSGMYVNCVYCGHRYGPGETTPVSMADALKAHIAQCPEHPMSDLLAALRRSLKFIRLGNHPNAGDMLDQAEAAIAKATGAAP